MVTTVNIRNASHASLVGARRIRVACAGTSIVANYNSQYGYLIASYGDKYQRCLTGGNSGQQAQNVADHFHTNVVNQDPAIVILAIAANDIIGGLTTDAPAPGAGSIANAKFYLTRILDQCLAHGIKAAIVSEPYRNPPQTGANGNIIYWNQTYIPALVASYNNPDIIYIDTGSTLWDASGNLLTPAISTLGTGTNGASTFTVASAAGITLGMCCYANSGTIGSVTLTRRVTGISGTTITFSGTLGGTLNETVYFYNDVYDNIHPSPVGAKKIAATIDAALTAAGWAPDYTTVKPLTSNAVAASVDNLIPYGTLEGSVSGGLHTGFLTNFSGTKTVAPKAGYFGNVQKVTLVPGEAGGNYLICPGASVVNMRGRWVVMSMKVTFTGFQPNGAVMDIRGNFDGQGTGPALPATFTDETNFPSYQSNMSYVDGTYIFHARVKVPQNASTYGWFFTNNYAFPAGAGSNATIEVGEICLFDNDHPLEDRVPRIPAVPYSSGNIPSTISPYDGFMAWDATSASVSKALPNVVTARGVKITILKSDASVNTITITGAAGGSVVLATQYAKATFISDGATWWNIT